MEKIHFERWHFVDHMRDIILLLMVLDHSLHAYAYIWGPFWFFQDSDRSFFYDALYLANQSIIMPMLFFIAGLFVLPSLERRGLGGYLKERAIRLGIPYLIGIPLVVPWLVYPRYEYTTQPGIGLWNFWWNVFFTEKLQGGGPFWVLYAIALYSAIFILLVKILPWFFKWSVKCLRWAIENPLWGFLGLGVKSAFLLGLSDLIWGAPWWIGFWKVFFLPASRFLLLFLYFFMGAAVTELGLFKDHAWLNRFAQRWPLWAILAAVFGVSYVGYSLAYVFDGAYSNEIRYHFRQGGTWTNAWPLIWAAAPAVLVRTTLQAFFIASLFLALWAVVWRFFKHPTPFWREITRHIYGIFIIHEVFVIWGQYLLVEWIWPPFMKILVIAITSLGLSWGVTNLLLRWSWGRHILWGGRYR